MTASRPSPPTAGDPAAGGSPHSRVNPQETCARARGSTESGRSETNRKAKDYELTPDGRHQLEAEVRNWKRISAAIDLALDTA